DETQNTLLAAQTSVADLRKQVSDQSSRISDLTKEVTTTGGTAGELQTKLADQEKQLADLKTQLDEANSTVADLKKQLASGDTQSTDLQKQLAEAKKASADAQQQLAAEKKTSAEAQQKLAAANASADSLKKQVSDNEVQISKLTGDLAAAQTRIKGLEKNATDVLDTFASIQNDYASVHGQLTGLIASGTPQDIQKAREILLQFIGGSGVNTILPGFSSVAAQVNTASDKVAETNGAKTGRENALTEVIRVTNYLSSPNSGTSAVDKAQIDKTAAQDPLFRQTAADIQRLAQQSGQATDHPGLAVSNQLIGTISYIASNTITVEKLVNISVREGATVVIQHKNGKGIEVPVAEGKVTGLAADSIQITVQSLLQGSTSPQLLDIVYLQSQSGA
ncbi:MAG TPA: hypothetical protein VMW69_02825, partial [Spirochaetia bacterium]|nr:hypothetical protein [Spirochaetia bacterium]